MIISTLHKFVFVAIPKTGTHSVRKALRDHMGPQDMEQVGLFVQRKMPIPALAQIGHGHISLAELRPHMRPEDFDASFKFAFVRNPFDRFLSYCAFMTRGQGHFERTPERVMRYYIQNPRHDHVLFQPQHTFVTDDAGELLSDYIGRVEQMQESYDEICRRIGIPSAPIGRLNTTDGRDQRGYREFYDQSLMEGVAKLYARDLELFGYEF